MIDRFIEQKEKASIWPRDERGENRKELTVITQFAQASIWPRDERGENRVGHAVPIPNAALQFGPAMNAGKTDGLAAFMADEKRASIWPRDERGENDPDRWHDRQPPGSFNLAPR